MVKPGTPRRRRSRYGVARMTATDSPGGPPAPEISVVVPAHNEEAYLEAAVTGVVEGLRARGRRFEVVVAENGSTDATGDVADRLAAAHPEVRVLRSAVPDYGTALRAGFEAATGEMVVNFDVDLVDLGFLDRSVAIMEGGDAAVVVGSKRSEGAEDERGLGRKVVTGVFAAVLHHGFGLRASDTHGLKLLRRRPLVEVVSACRFGADIFDTELVLRAERAGLAVLEIPVAVADQRPPRTPIVRRIPRTLLGLARLRRVLWAEARHH